MTVMTDSPVQFGPVVTRAMVLAEVEERRQIREEEQARELRRSLADDANERMAREAALARGEIMSMLDPVPVPTVSQVLARQLAAPEPPERPSGSWGYIGDQYDVQQRREAAVQRSHVERMDPVIRRYEEGRRAMAPHLAGYRQRQAVRAEREMERLRRSVRSGHGTAELAAAQRHSDGVIGGSPLPEIVRAEIRRTAYGDVDV